MDTTEQKKRVLTSFIDEIIIEMNIDLDADTPYSFFMNYLLANINDLVELRYGDED